MDFFENFEPVVLSYPQRSCGPLANSIHCQYSCITEWRRIKRTCGVTFVMFGEQQPLLAIKRRINAVQCLPEKVLQK